MRISDWSSDVCSSDLHGIEADPEWIEQEPIPLLLARPTLGDLSCYLDSIGQVVGQGVDINTSDAIEQIATVGGAFGYGRYADVGEPQQSGLVAVPSGSLHKRPDIVDKDRKSTRLTSITNAHLV